jgi:hypothetical protein
MHKTTMESRPRLLPQRKKFTAEDVLQRLQVDQPNDSRTRAVHAAAARTALWSSLLPDDAAFQLGSVAHRLPSVVFWYRQGVACSVIGRRLSPFGSSWDAERALDVAAQLIAAALNRGVITDIAA